MVDGVKIITNSSGVGQNVIVGVEALLANLRHFLPFAIDHVVHDQFVIRDDSTMRLIFHDLILCVARSNFAEKCRFKRFDGNFQILQKNFTKNLD